MRTALLVSAISALGLLELAACSRGPDTPRALFGPLPELVVAEPASAAPIAVRELLLVPQEQLIWDVHWKGLTIGRMELKVDGDEVHSRFRTGAVVRTVTSIDHELATVLDRTGARAASQHEALTVDGDARVIDAVFDGAGYRIAGQPAQAVRNGSVHTLHSALGALRAWARPGAKPGFLTVLIAGEPVRLEVGEPVAEQLQERQTLRIDGRAIGGRTLGGGEPVTVKLWLRASEDRAPLRIELATDEARVSAELLEE
jgi:hypothetical protein